MTVHVVQLEFNGHGLAAAACVCGLTCYICQPISNFGKVFVNKFAHHWVFFLVNKIFFSSFSI